MKFKCDYCGKEFEKSPSAAKRKNYCCKECRHRDKYLLTKCKICGKEIERIKAGMLPGQTNFYCKECAKKANAERFRQINKALNPTRMTKDTRDKLRKSRLDTGAGVTYSKTYGRHTHRVVAEQILGRPLKPGEVVHHIDGDKRNNDPSNLMIFSSQAEHAKYHQQHGISST